MGIEKYESLNGMSRLWGLLLMVSGIIFSPFYVYASGLPQPAHVVMLVAALALITLNASKCKNLAKENRIGVLFLSLVALINVVYAAIYLDKGFIVSTVYWVYGYLLLLAVMCIARDKVLAVWIGRLIVLELLLVAISYLVGWGSYTWWPRYEYFFNGPNQLAYFVICLLLVYTAVTVGKMGWGFYFAYALTVFAIITTGGRSAYLAGLPLILLFLWMARKRAGHLVLLMSIPVVVNMAFQPLCLPLHMPSNQGNVYTSCLDRPDSADARDVSSNTISRIDNLSVNKEVTDHKSVWTQLFARGYMRVVQYPQYLLYGAGQGRDERFGEVGGYVYEIHSSLIAVLFYYGVAGALLFAAFLWGLFTVKRNVLFLSPLFVYGLFTYGLRSPYFWMALGFLVLMPDLLKSSQDMVDD